MGTEREVRKPAGKKKTVHMAAATKVLGCSRTTRNTVLGEELGMYPLETNWDMSNLKWQYV